MPVAFDAKSTLVGLASGLANGTNNETGVLTVGASATFLLVGVECETTTGGVTGVTWNSVATTQVGTSSVLSTVSTSTVWGLVSPASGSRTLGIVASGLAAAANVYFFGISFTGTATASVAAATKGFAKNTATNTALTVTSGVSLAATEMAVAFGIDVGSGFSNSTTETMGGTQIGENQAQTNNGCAAYFTGAGSTVTASATLVASDLWGAVIVGIAASSAAAPVLALPRRMYLRRRWAGWRASPLGGTPMRKQRPALVLPSKGLILPSGFRRAA